MKKLAEIKGAKVLDDKAQESIVGGKIPFCPPPLEPMYSPLTGWSCC